MKTALTIAGSDSIGGAGIQADLKTFLANGVYGMSVITALTAQNTLGVLGIQGVDSAFLGQQLDAVFRDIMPNSTKIGMVYDISNIQMIAKKLQEYGLRNIVVDPVMAATSKDPLILHRAKEALAKELFPLATLITPNISEAEVLAETSIHSKEEMEKAGQFLQEKYHCSVLVKGGHLEQDADDVLVEEGTVLWFPGKRIFRKNTHGTGCTLSSAIAASLAKGIPLKQSISAAKTYVSLLIESGPELGKGPGPLNHAALLQDRNPYHFLCNK